MSVNHKGIEAKSFQALPVDFEIMLERSGLTLSQSVDIEDDHQIVQFVVASKIESLPDGSFSTLSISNQAVDPINKNMDKKI